jgi:hypothetical protein
MLTGKVIQALPTSSTANINDTPVNAHTGDCQTLPGLVLFSREHQDLGLLPNFASIVL